MAGDSWIELCSARVQHRVCWGPVDDTDIGSVLELHLPSYPTLICKIKREKSLCVGIKLAFVDFMTLTNMGDIVL